MQHLFDIKTTQLEMVRDRGYTISPEEEPILQMTSNDFTDYMSRIAAANPRASLRSLLSRSYDAVLPDGTKRTMLVYYGGKTNPQQKQVPADVVREFIGLVQKYRITEAVLIVDAPLSSTGDNELGALRLTKWQVFFDSELTYNPSRHVDCPHHQLLTQEEAESTLRQARVDRSKLLIIKIDDPIVRYYGWQAGGIVRVHRNDQSVSVLAPKSINYCVILG